MVYTFLNLIEETLKAIKNPLSPDDIWKEAQNLKFTEKLGSSGKTPSATIGARLYLDIKNNPNTTIFIQTSKRPSKFYLKSLPLPIVVELNKDVNIVPEQENNNQQEETYNERDLHVLLSTFVYSNPHFNCYTKTIFHEISKKNKKGYNEWLHPDLVGIYFPFKEFQDGTLKLLDTFKENACKLFSFEMKMKLDFPTLRQYYFQAVSNSSWAHEGYLVALKIAEDPLLIDEIRRLNNSFGIGVIKLNAENIEQSEILFPAKTKEFLDWETIDRLIEENTDFNKFIDDLTKDVKVSEVKSKYDEVLLDPVEYIPYVTNKGILKLEKGVLKLK